MTNVSSELLFSIFGLVAGVASLVFLIITFRKGPEALRGALLHLTIGVALVTLAFVWDIVFSSQLFGLAASFDLHHLLVAISVLFFVNAARKFYQIGR